MSWGRAQCPAWTRDQVEVTVADEALGAFPNLLLLQGRSTGLQTRLSEDAAVDTHPRGPIGEPEKFVSLRVTGAQ